MTTCPSVTARHWSVLLATLVLAAGSAAAASQKVFRCGPDGRIYSQTPCKDGYEAKADDARSAEQRKAAEELAKRDEKLAEQMRRERQAKEAAAAKQGAVTVGNPSPASPAASAVALKKKRPPKKPDQG